MPRRDTILPNKGAGKLRIGDRFGKYVVASTAYVAQRERGRCTVCLCDCDCGNRREVTVSNLLRNKARSCGCRKAEVTRKRSLSHGLSGTRPYRIWIDMQRRCEQPNHLPYCYYGERGVTVCQEWRDSFEAFFDWALANGYRHDLTLDRIDTNGNYEPGNCRWADMLTQQNNRRSTRIAEAFGERKSLSEWSRDSRCRVDYSTLFWRYKRGVPIEQAMTKPARPLKRRAQTGS